MTMRNSEGTISELIEALQIFLKYGDIKYPTNCEHDKLSVCISPELISRKDVIKLEELSFTIDEDEDCFYSFTYGSC